MSPRIVLLLATCAVLPGQDRPWFALPADAGAAGEVALALPKAAGRTPAERAELAQQRLASLSQPRFDVEARAAEVASPEAAHALLRDEIAFDSYCGVLRGARGTYTERAGNALDRALLLGYLLGRQGMRCRFVRGRLPQERQEQLLDRLFARAGDAPAAGRHEPAELPARMLARAQRDYRALRAALGDKVAMPATDRGELLAEVADHFWVQGERDGRWIDFDPLFADLEPGRAACPVEQTYDAIPAELHQTVCLRVLTESLVDGASKTTPALELVLPAKDLLDEQVFLVHTPQEALGNGIAALLGGGERAWFPVLAVGGDAHVGQAIRFGLPPAGGGVLDALSTGPAAPAAATSPLVAEWLEVELRFPDGRTELHRRALLDRAGPVLRSRGAFTLDELQPLPTDEAGPLCCQDVHNLAFSAGRHDLHAFATAMAWLCEDLAARDPAEPFGGGEPVGLDALWPLALQAIAWQIQSDHRVVPALNDRHGVRLYAEAPRVWITSVLRTGPRPEDTALVLDLRRDRLRGICAAPDLAAELAARKLWFAVLQGALEHELLAEVAGNSGLDPRLVATASSWLRGGLSVLGPGADVAAALPDPLAAAHAAAALARGSAVVAPRGLPAGEVAFWELEPGGDARAVYGLDWNGAQLVFGMQPGKLGGYPPGKSYAGGSKTPPSHYNPGNSTGGTNGRPPKAWNPNGSGGGGPKGGGPKGGGGGPKGGPKGGGRLGPKPGGRALSEYVSLLMNVSIPAAYGYFAVGLGIEVTAGYAAALFIEAGAQ